MHGLCTIARVEHYLNQSLQTKIGIFEIDDPLLLIDLKNSKKNRFFLNFC